MITKTLSIGPKGQIILPKKIRELFKTNTVVLKLIDNNHAVIFPVPDVAGSLAKFAHKSKLSFDEIRNNAWIDSRQKRKD